MLEVFLFVATVILVVLFWPVFLGLVVLGAAVLFFVLYPKALIPMSVLVAVSIIAVALKEVHEEWQDAKRVRQREDVPTVPDTFD